jgi:predicted nucleic acid-binding protein
LQVATLPSGAARQAEQLYGVGGLGFGEAQAIALAREIRADWLLTDDAGVRVVAVALGLEVHGSLGVILRAAAAGNIRRGEAVSALNGLAKSSLWISSDLLREAREALDRLLPP